MKKKMTKICNNILLNLEDKCQCYNKKGYPSDNIEQCARINDKEICKDYNICKKYFKSKLSGSEPVYQPEKWNPKYILNSHNCYTYFLNDHNTHTIQMCKDECKQKKSCSKPRVCSRNLNHSQENTMNKNNKKIIRNFNCNIMIKNIKKITNIFMK